MTLELDADPDTALFTTLVDVSLAPEDCGPCVSDTQLAVLAWEITTYMPALATKLARAGRSRLLAA